MEAHWELILPNLGASDGIRDNPSAFFGVVVDVLIGLALTVIGCVYHNARQTSWLVPGFVVFNWSPRPC